MTVSSHEITNSTKDYTYQKHVQTVFCSPVQTYSTTSYKLLYKFEQPSGNRQGE